MNELVAFLDYLAKATPVFIVFATLLGFYYREKIKQVLSHSLLGDIERLKRDLSKELAEHSAQLQRDVEAYKVTLIADAERARATQEVKKSLALRMGERRFNALFGLLDAHMGFDTSIVAHASGVLDGEAAIVQQVYSRNATDLLARFTNYTSAANSAHAFLTMEQRQKVLEIRDSAIKLLSGRGEHASPAIPKEGELPQKLLRASIVLEDSLRNTLEEMERLD